jgi:hypothetical protein
VNRDVTASLCAARSSKARRDADDGRPWSTAIISLFPLRSLFRLFPFSCISLLFRPASTASVCPVSIGKHRSEVCTECGWVTSSFQRFRRNEPPPSSVTSVSLRALQMFVVLFCFVSFVSSSIRCSVLFCLNYLRLFCFLQFDIYYSFPANPSCSPDEVSQTERAVVLSP